MNSVRGLLAAFGAEALAAALWILFTRSESDRAVVLWLSPERLVLLGIVVLILAALLALALAAWRSRGLLASFEFSLDYFCLERQWLVPWVLLLLAVPLVVLVVWLAVPTGPGPVGDIRSSYREWAPDTFPLLRSLVAATLPLQLLLAAFALELAAYLGLRYRRSLRERRAWAWHRLGPTLLLLGSALLTVFHWLVLAFQLRFFKNNPAWYWKFEPLPFGRGDLLFLLGAAVLAALAYWLLLVRRRTLAGLIVLFVLGLFLQFGVGLMSGGGFASFQERYFSSYHKSYVAKASSSSAGLLETVRQYEQLYGTRAFTETKPPGLMLFYTALDHIVNGFPARYPDDVRYQRLATMISLLFPVLATSMVFAVYGFARRYTRGEGGIVARMAAFLLVLSPNFVLFSLFADQAVYPLLFLLGVFCAVVTVRRQSPALALLLGIGLYAAAFFAFTMLPLYPVAGLYLLLYYLSNRAQLRLGRAAWLAAAIAAGTLLAYLVFRYALGYDFLPRFARTMTINHAFDFYLRVGKHLPAGPEAPGARLSQIAGAAWLNNLDFAAAAGFAIYLLFLVQAIRVLARLFSGRASSSDLVLAALLLSFLLLNLAGTAQGEVPRLWLFWLPMVVITVALHIEHWIMRRPWLMLVLAGAQLATLFLTFHFQDLRM